MDSPVTLYLGDCLGVMATLPPNSVDSIVTDPPYGLSFMGKDWDHGIPGEHFWREALRVAKPGAHLLAFGGTRTFHRLAVAIEDAGWELRDVVSWIYGSGFPKSLDISKAIDKASGAEREIVGERVSAYGSDTATGERVSRPDGGAGLWVEADPKVVPLRGGPATDAVKQWDGWGTALKPAWEPIIVARKPLEGTVAANVLEYGTGGINVDGCRVPIDPAADASQLRVMSRNQRTEDANGQKWGMSKGAGDAPQVVRPEGRFPANLIHDGSDEVLECFPSAPGQQGDLKGHANERQSPNGCFGKMAPAADHPKRQDSSTSAARFFYCAKANKSDREEGNNHPTVKPTALMRYLCRLVTPPNGVVLDPFMGSGSTGKAALAEGFRFVGIEKEAEYLEIARMRVKAS